MAFEIQENVILQFPDLKDRMSEFTESESFRDNNKLIIEIAAIHAGLTANYTHYTAGALEASLASWVHPYPRPIILNHDEMTEPIGRVMASTMDRESDDTSYIRLQVAIMDPLAIEKIADKRYITGSVGGSAESARCSICDIDWGKANMSEGLPCKHRRGNVYEGKIASLILGEIKWREYSFVNVPADSNSGIRPASSEDAEDAQWSYAIQMFSMDMNRPFISKISESNSENVLAAMKKRDATATYMNLKGTFLSVSAVDYVENENVVNTINNEFDTNNDDYVLSKLNESRKESEMSVGKAIKTAEAAEDDILAISEQLNADLAADDSGSDVSESETNTETDELSEESDVKADTEVVEGSEEPAQESDVSDEQLDSIESDESEQAESTDVVSEGDVEAEESTEISEDSGDTEDTDTVAIEAEDAADETIVSDSDESTETAEAEVETSESIESEEENEEVTALKQENTSLRSALHRMLVERVVDNKIAKGVTGGLDRKTLVEEHSTRTASSLADALRDLDHIPTHENFKAPEMEIRTLATDVNEPQTETVGDNSKNTTPQEQVDSALTAEAIFTDVLMNRKKI